MVQHDIHSDAYARRYLDSHNRPDDPTYRMDYWSHLFIDSIVNKNKETQTHLLEEGGGTCGIYRSLSFDQYTSVDVSGPMTVAARNSYDNDPTKTFISWDISSGSLSLGAYSAIIAGAFGVYYRPDVAHLRRLHELLAQDGLLYVAIDPVLDMKHFLASPVATLIDKHIRPYRRISSRSFEQMVKQAGFRIWLATDYIPAPGWRRRAFFMNKIELPRLDG